MLRFQEPRPVAGGWSWEIAGGLLAKRPGGSLTFRWDAGRLTGRVDGYAPRLPWLVYVLFQLRLHHAVTRLFLLQLRGRLPPPGVPAEPALRLVAGAADVCLCFAVSQLAGRRRLLAFPAVAAVYHYLSWTRGWSLASKLLRMELRSVDGSRVGTGQAIVRMLWLPASLLRLRALHDEAAGTEVVRSRREPRFRTTSPAGTSAGTRSPSRPRSTPASGNRRAVRPARG